MCFTSAVATRCSSKALNLFFCSIPFHPSPVRLSAHRSSFHYHFCEESFMKHAAEQGMPFYHAAFNRSMGRDFPPAIRSCHGFMPVMKSMLSSARNGCNLGFYDSEYYSSLSISCQIHLFPFSNYWFPDCTMFPLSDYPISRIIWLNS